MSHMTTEARRFTLISCTVAPFGAANLDLTSKNHNAIALTINMALLNAAGVQNE